MGVQSILAAKICGSKWIDAWGQVRIAIENTDLKFICNSISAQVVFQGHLVVSKNSSGAAMPLSGGNS
jgi:hypothetical protein